LASLLSLSVMTPEQVLLQVEGARRVRLKLVDQAWLSIYPYHSPLLAEALPGPLQYDTELETGEIRIDSAILYVSDNTVTVLTSGLLGGQEPGAEQAPSSSSRFDRLARELMLALRAQADARPELFGGEGAVEMAED
jgi:F0F1-type ATP synthase epsilon subunit